MDELLEATVVYPCKPGINVLHMQLICLVIVQKYCCIAISNTS